MRAANQGAAEERFRLIDESHTQLFDHSRPPGRGERQAAADSRPLYGCRPVTPYAGAAFSGASSRLHGQARARLPVAIQCLGSAFG
jgi:hypothetical protein